jgi:stage II sporulation protein D
MKKDSIYLHGKGYGHGVGLSQEGAIKMVQLGYSYIDILRFYYNHEISSNTPISSNFNNIFINTISITHKQ